MKTSRTHPSVVMEQRAQVSSFTSFCLSEGPVQLSPQILGNFDHWTIKNTLTYCMTAWQGKSFVSEGGESLTTQYECLRSVLNHSNLLQESWNILEDLQDHLQNWELEPPKGPFQHCNGSIGPFKGPESPKTDWLAGRQVGKVIRELLRWSFSATRQEQKTQS